MMSFIGTGAVRDLFALSAKSVSSVSRSGSKPGW